MAKRRPRASDRDIVEVLDAIAAANDAIDVGGYKLSIESLRLPLVKHEGSIVLVLEHGYIVIRRT